jgi:hypothetical protein
MSISAGDSPPERANTRPPALDRITVALIPKAGDDLQKLQERTGLSKTDITNRAISLYEFIDSQIQSGRDLIIRDTRTGESQIVHIL